MGYAVFCAQLPPPPPPIPPILVIVGTACTTHGGCELRVLLDQLLVDLSRDQDFLGRVLPVGWANLVTGSGTVTVQQGLGLLFNSGTAGNSQAGIESTQTYTNGDAAFDFEILDAHESVLDAADLAVFEWTSALGDVARVRVLQGVGASRGQLVALGEEVVGGTTIMGGIEAWDATKGTLRIVRNGTRVFGFVGTREPGTASVYTRLVKVLDVKDFTTGGGVLRIYCASRARRSRVRARFSRFTLRPHVTISGRLLVNKIEISGHLIGQIPAATLEELGAVPFTVFGLFGSLTDNTGFTYTLPVPLTVGLEATRTGITVQDPVLKDGV
jgi:hypothetical protein